MKSSLLLSLALATLAFGCVSPQKSNQFAITNEGQTNAQIVVGEKPPESVAFAAKELQTFVNKMSGAELPIVAKASKEVPSIRLGPAAIEKMGGDALKGVRRDGYHIAVVDGDLCVAGIDDVGPQTDIEALLEKKITHDPGAWNFHRGTLYGVYRLLEELGMRWYFPGKHGERTPSKPTLTFKGEILENPHFISRTVSYWSLGNARVQFRKDWKAITIMPGERNAIGFSAIDNRLWELRMRGESFRIPLNHNPPRARWSDRFGKSNPEYFALTNDGSRLNGRNAHLCYTNPGVVEENVKDINAFIAGKDAHERGIMTNFPYNRNWSSNIAFGDYFSIFPNDGFRQCQCEKCKAKVPSNPKERGVVHSKLVWDYVDKVARQVPDAKVTCLAYGSYSVPYEGMPKLPDNVVVGFCAHSCPARLYYRDNFKQLEALLGKWSKLTNNNMAFWQHYLSSNRGEATVGMPEHIPEMYAKTIRTLSRHGNHAFCEMMADSIMFELFNRYLVLKLFYNPNLDEKALFNDYVMTYYGPDAGPIIKGIYDDIEKKTITRFKNNYASFSVWERLFDEKTMRGYHEKANLAAKMAAGTKYETAVNAFRDFYLGLMERGRGRYADPLGQLLASFNPELVSRPVGKPPKLDSSDPAWKRAQSVAFGNTTNGKATKRPANVRCLRDKENLYFLIKATDPNAEKIKTKPGVFDKSESVEIYLDAPRKYRGYRRVGVDLDGDVEDYRWIDDVLLADHEWKSGAKTSAKRNAEGYEIGVAIPWKSLGLTFEEAKGTEIGALVARRQANPPVPEDAVSSTSIILRGDPDNPGVFNALSLSRR